MGLDTSHDCWHGAYSAFMRFRTTIASVIGIDLMKMAGFATNGLDGVPRGDAAGVAWDSLPPDPLHVLLCHSDCDGEIAWQDAAPIADRLESILPALEALDVIEKPGGHLHDGYAAAARRFAAGCWLAAEHRENISFH